MNMNGVHCQVSPTSTIRRADHGSVAQAHSPRPRQRLSGAKRPLLHVGEHAEGVGDADRRHHQRHEEDDAEEAPAADRLGAEERQAEAEQELHGHADDDVEERGDERAGKAAGDDAWRRRGAPAPAARLADDQAADEAEQR